jgi:polysaccharide biosynthesis protein PslH
LIITDYLPYPPISGDKIRVYNLIRRIAVRHQVSIASLASSSEDIGALQHLKSFCQNVVIGDKPNLTKFQHITGILKLSMSGKPFEFEFLYSEDLARKINQLASRIDFDIVQVEPSRMAPYIESLPTGSHGKKIVVFHNIAYNQYNLISQLERTLIKKIRPWLHGRIMREWEPRYAKNFDICVMMSELERAWLNTANPRLQTAVIPNGVDTVRYKPLFQEESPPALLFIGSMDYPPCTDAAIFLCKRVLPLVRQAIPEILVWIVGANPPPVVKKLIGDGVYVTGRVEDVVPYYKKSTICAVPLRAGGGTRLKILEAMALGRPVVSTAIGCEGLDVIDGEHLLVAESPEQFSKQILRILNEKGLYRHIAAQARQLVVSKYNWDSIAQQLMDIYVS